MGQYVGLDVSLEVTTVHVLDEQGKRCQWRMKLPQMWRVKNPQTVCLVMDCCLAGSRRFWTAAPGGVVEAERY
jgi:hypothetical protein